MIIGIANDHNGVNWKNELVTLLIQSGYKVKNYGTDTEESVDYPLYAFKIGEAINKKEIDLGRLTLDSQVLCIYDCGMNTSIPNRYGILDRDLLLIE